MFTRAITFIFGSGWWILWHLFMLLWLLPLAWVVHWMWTIVPGAGPQGGEAVAFLLLLAFVALLLASLVNALLWASTLASPWATRYVGLLVLVLAGGAVLLGLLFWLSQIATAPELSTAARRTGVAGFVLVFAAIYVANLWAVWRFRRRALNLPG